MNHVLKTIIILPLLSGALAAGEVSKPGKVLIKALSKAQLNPDENGPLTALATTLPHARALKVTDAFIYAAALGSRLNDDAALYKRAITRLAAEFPDSPFNAALKNTKKYERNL